MSEKDTSERVSGLIFEHIDSVSQLEILLLLRQQEKRAWTVAEICSELRSNLALVKKSLLQLQYAKLIRESELNPGFFQYDPEKEEIISELAEEYRVRPHRVFALIFSPMKRARHFSDAFSLFRKKKEDGEPNG